MSEVRIFKWLPCNMTYYTLSNCLHMINHIAVTIYINGIAMLTSCLSLE